MRLLLVFARAYPRHSLVIVGCLLLAAVAEGIGITTALPILELATEGESDAGEAAGGTSLKQNLKGAIAASIRGVGLEPTMAVLLSVLVLAFAIKAALMLVAKKQVGYTVAHVATDLRLALLRALLATRWSYYTRQPSGVVANAFATECSRASQSYLYGSNIASMGIQTALYTGVAFVISWQATLGAIGIGIVITYLLRSLVRMARRAGTRQTLLLRSTMGRLTDSLQAVKPLKAMARETLFGPMLEGETRRLKKALQRQVLSKEAMKVLQEFLTIACLAVGIGVATQFLGIPLAEMGLLAVLFGRALVFLGRAQRHYQNIVSHESEYWSLRDVIDRAQAEREVMRGTREPILRREVAVRHVDFTYEARPVLRDCSLVIPVGQITALVGGSGTGKTTLGDLIVGLVEPDAGEILIDDVPLGEIDLAKWRGRIGYVPQEMLLLHDSVLLNITLGDADLGPADAEAALRRAGAWEFVAELPEQLDTVVGERGTLLSGGQRQRIAIARALVHEPELLILDEATTALDPQTEASVWDAIAKLRGESTILAISHPPALVKVADRVYRIQDGAARLLSSEQAAGAAHGAS